MNIREILKLLTEDLEKLDDKQLNNLLGPLIPQSRTPDKESAAKRDQDQLIKMAKAMLGQT